MFREHTFRFSWPVLAAFMAAAVVVGDRVFFAIKRMPQPSLADWGFDALQIGLVVLFCVLVRRLFVVQVGVNGVRSTAGIGRYHDVRWDAMRSVRTVTGFLWIPYGKPGAALMFPLFLDRSAEFRNYVLAHAPAGNPLRAYLAAR